MDIGFALFALIINNAIGVHRKTLLNKALADQRMRGYSSHKEFYIHKTAEGVETLAAPLFVHALDTARDLNEVLEKNGSKCGEDGPKDAEGEHDG